MKYIINLILKLTLKSITSDVNHLHDKARNMIHNHRGDTKECARYLGMCEAYANVMSVLREHKHNLISAEAGD